MKTLDDIAAIVDTDGLDYAITDYMKSDDFEDRELAVLWDAAKVLLDQITNTLEPAMDRLNA